MGLLIFTFLLIVVFLHKIIFCCIHGRALVAIRHKCGFALRLFDVSRQEFIKAGLAEELLHGGDAEQLFLIRVKACFLDRVNDGGLIAVSAVAASFDELKASPFLQIQQNSAGAQQKMDNKQTFNYEKASEVLKEISTYFEFPQFQQTFGDNTENVKSIIQNTLDALDKKEDEGLIKKSLKVLKDLAIGAGGSLIGSGILALLGTIPL